MPETYPDILEFKVPYATVTNYHAFKLHRLLGHAKLSINQCRRGAIYTWRDGQWRKIYQYDPSHRFQEEYIDRQGNKKYRVGRIDWTHLDENITDQKRQSSQAF